MSAKGFLLRAAAWLAVVLLLGCAGPPGPPGIQGTQGAQGVRGEQGTQGEQGSPGIQGERGPTGHLPSLASLVEGARDAVVCVTVDRSEGQSFCGTGFYIDEQGTVLTAAHLLEDALRVSIAGHDYQAQPPMDNIDTILLYPSTPRKGLPYLKPSGRQPKVGELMVILGYPANSGKADVLLVTSGVLSGSYAVSVDGVAVFPRYHFLDLFSAPGSSGSPVLTRSGELVGLLTHGEFQVFEGNTLGGFSFALDIGEVQFE